MVVRIPPEMSSAPPPAGEKGQPPSLPLAKKLVFLAQPRPFFRSSGEAWVTLDDGTTCRIKSEEFQEWLQRQAYTRLGEVAPESAIKSAVRTLASLTSQAEEVKLYKRVAGVGDRVWLDLGDGQHVEVTPDGWNVRDEAQVKFRRVENYAPLPEPQTGGSVAPLREMFAAVPDDAWSLILGWLLDALKGHGPYLVLILSGVQGSCKTYLSKTLKRLLDPTKKAPLTSIPHTEDDVALLAETDHVLAFDNVSGLSQRQSDILCRLTHGSGFRKRTLYTNDGQTIFDSANPILLNGIPDFSDSNDLIDRAVRVVLPEVRTRVAERELDATFDRIRPIVLGGLLDLLAAGLRDRPRTTIPPTRMYDSALWVTACTGSQEFLTAYAANREEAAEVALDGSPLAQLLLGLLDWEPEGLVHTPPAGVGAGRFHGTTNQLREAIRYYATVMGGYDAEADLRTAKALNNKLRRDKPALERVGVTIEFGKTNGRRWVEVRKAPGTVPGVTGTVEAPSGAVGAVDAA